MGPLFILNTYLAWGYGRAEIKNFFKFKRISFHDWMLFILGHSLSLGIVLQQNSIGSNNEGKADPFSEFLDKIANGLASPNWQIVALTCFALFSLALLEEFLFRSFIIKKAEEQNVAFTVIILSTIVFGLGHAAIYPQLISGLIYSWIFVKYRSILMTGLMHFFFNLLCFLMMTKRHWDFTLDLFLQGEQFEILGMGLVAIGSIPIAIIIRELYKKVGPNDKFFSPQRFSKKY